MAIITQPKNYKAGDIVTAQAMNDIIDTVLSSGGGTGGIGSGSNYSCNGSTDGKDLSDIVSDFVSGAPNGKHLPFTAGNKTLHLKLSGVFGASAAVEGNGTFGFPYILVRAYLDSTNYGLGKRIILDFSSVSFGNLYKGTDNSSHIAFGRFYNCEIRGDINLTGIPNVRGLYGSSRNLINGDWYVGGNGGEIHGLQDSSNNVINGDWTIKNEADNSYNVGSGNVCLFCVSSNNVFNGKLIINSHRNAHVFHGSSNIVNGKIVINNNSGNYAASTVKNTRINYDGGSYNEINGNIDIYTGSSSPSIYSDKTAATYLNNRGIGFKIKGDVYVINYGQSVTNESVFYGLYSCGSSELNGNCKVGGHGKSYAFYKQYFDTYLSAYNSRNTIRGRWELLTSSPDEVCAAFNSSGGNIFDGEFIVYNNNTSAGSAYCFKNCFGDDIRGAFTAIGYNAGFYYIDGSGASYAQSSASFQNRVSLNNLEICVMKNTANTTAQKAIKVHNIDAKGFVFSLTNCKFIEGIFYSHTSRGIAELDIESLAVPTLQYLIVNNIFYDHTAAGFPVVNICPSPAPDKRVFSNNISGYSAKYIFISY